MAIFKLPRIATADRTTLVLAESELVYDTDLDQVFSGDGTTAGGLGFGGGSGITRTIESKSANFSAGGAALTDYAYVCTGTITGTLPTAVGNTNQYDFKNAGAGVVSIATTASETIDGTAAPITIPLPSMSLTLISDGANWIIA